MIENTLEQDSAARVDVPLAALGRSAAPPLELAPGTGDALRRWGPELAPALEHPGPSTLAAVAAVRDRLAGDGHPRAAAALARFHQLAAALGPARLEELYGRSFDLAPCCAPYLSVHLFGEGSYQRARLMCGLAAAYGAAGFDPGPELPDHLAVVLRFAPRMERAEWRDLLRFCLLPALPAMARAFGNGENPYRLVIEALVAASAPPVDGTAPPCAADAGGLP